MTNEEFDNLKQELLWEGSQVAVLDSNEQARTRAHARPRKQRTHTRTHTHAHSSDTIPASYSASWRRPCPSRAASRA
jgi:hypothetical protein